MTPTGPRLDEAYRSHLAVYRRLLRLLPSAIVREHESDMLSIFRDHLAASRHSWRARLAVWAGAVADILRHRGALVSDGNARPPSGATRHGLRTLIGALWRDARYGVRLLRRDWSFTLTATVILGIAIGANTAIFSFVDTFLLRPLPYPHPDRLAVVTRVYESGGVGISQDGRTWETVRDSLDPSVRAAVYSNWSTGVNLATGDAAMNVSQQRIGAGFFAALGVPPALGREFTPLEDVDGGPAVTVLSDRTWRRLFDGDPSAIGESVLLQGRPHTVLGVMPPEFISSAQADLWTPLAPSTTGEGEGENYQILLRLGPESTPAVVVTQLDTIGQSLMESDYQGSRFTMSMTSLQAGDTSDLQQPLWLLSISVGVVLLVACVNVSGLLLVRGRRRGREIATRMAVGGGRAAVLRQLLVESLVLALLGGLAGLALATALLRVLTSFGAGVLDTWRPVALDARVLAATVGISVLTALLFGLAPALQAGRVSIHDALRHGGGRGVAGGRHWGRRLLVVAEVALSVVLLVMAGLLLQTFLHLQNLEPGFEPEGVVAVSVSLQDARYETREQAEGLFEEGLRRLRDLPGTVSAAAALGMPYERLLNLGFEPLDFEGERTITNLSYVTSDFFETLRMPVLRGRPVDASDVHDSEPVAVVNEAFARVYMPGSAVVGHSIATAGAERRIIGLVASVQQTRSWGDVAPVTDAPAVYVPVSQVSGEFLKLVHTWFAPAWIIRVSGDPATAIPTIEHELASVDPLLPLASTRLLGEIRSSAVSRERFVAVLVGVLAGAAIVLACLGIYGLVASTVTEQQREIGIRLALGASGRNVLAAVALPSVGLASLGAVIGIFAALGAVRFLEAFLWGVSPTDPWTFAAVGALLLVAAALASLIPARRAARLDPARTLGAE